MEYSAESLRYLHIAYALFLLVQVAYVAWLAVRWSRVQAQARTLLHDTPALHGTTLRSRNG